LLDSSSSPAAFSGVLAVGQTSTPGFSPLPGTAAELSRIEDQVLGLRFTRLDGDKATAPAVLAAMEEHSWVHFACHATQDPTKPTESAFHLHNDSLSLATISQKQLKFADLAFLSACQTAAGDESLSEEAVHLAAGMMMTGYRSVIATMWSIQDQDAPLVAERFYTQLLEGGTPNARGAAKALHVALGHLRVKVGVKEFGRWASYIHIGW
jgi:CHAT domain-containing protein